MLGFYGPGFSPLDSAAVDFGSTGGGGASAFTSWDLGGCNCGCSGCFGCPFPATDLTGSYHHLLSGLIGSGTLVYSGPSSTLIWRDYGALSNVGCTWDGTFTVSNGGGAHTTLRYQLVCSGTCTAFLFSNLPPFPPNQFGFYESPGSCDTVNNNNIGSDFGLGFPSVSCSPLHIQWSLGGGIAFITISP